MVAGQLQLVDAAVVALTAVRLVLAAEQRYFAADLELYD